MAFKMAAVSVKRSINRSGTPICKYRPRQLLQSFLSQVLTVSGHKNEASIRSYRKTGICTKKMSESLPTRCEVSKELSVMNSLWRYIPTKIHVCLQHCCFELSLIFTLFYFDNLTLPIHNHDLKSIFQMQCGSLLNMRHSCFYRE